MVRLTIGYVRIGWDVRCHFYAERVCRAPVTQSVLINDFGAGQYVLANHGFETVLRYQVHGAL